MASNTAATTDISYTFNEGKTWHTLTISEEAFEVTNIIIEPDSVAQEFVVYGVRRDPETNKDDGVAITLDFKELHEP